MDDDYKYSSEEEGAEEEEYYSSDLPEDPPVELDKEETSRKQRCKVITKESLLAAQKEDLRKVMDLLELSEKHARTLLIHYGWDVDKLFTVFVEKGSDRLFEEAGVRVVELRKRKRWTIVSCDVCMEDVSSDDITTMDCGHFFCNNCWTEHFIVKINEGQSRRIRCMVHKCNTICDEAVIRNLVSKRDCQLAERFDRFLLQSYIEDNKMVKWCPSVPHCGNAIRVEDDVYCEVECSCGLQFCFSCLSNAHSPCPCAIWKLWTKKCEDESETSNWICAHTMNCPKCLKPVEKNGGCNYVLCICGQRFCWLCGALPCQCRINNASHEEKKTQAKRYLYRYILYHNRYKDHKDSFKLATPLESQMVKKISNLQTNEFTFGDFSWVINGLHRLYRSRRVLLYSYPFAYYMFGDEFIKDEMTDEDKAIKQYLFEDQQQVLEANVEKLSKLLMQFRDHSEDNIMEMRTEVTDLSAYIDELCRRMYDRIENDLLGSLQMDIYNIAPYKSNGVEKAIQLPGGLDAKQLIPTSGK